MACHTEFGRSRSNDERIRRRSQKWELGMVDPIKTSHPQFGHHAKFGHFLSYRTQEGEFVEMHRP